MYGHTFGSEGTCMDTHGRVGQVHVWPQVRVGGYICGHIGESGWVHLWTQGVRQGHLWTQEGVVRYMYGHIKGEVGRGMDT